MPNVPNKNAEADGRFIEEVARLLVPWGVPQTAARIYGRLVLSAEPVSLDQLAIDLEVSKSSASVAARTLETYRMVRRHSVRGSRRVLYEVSDSYERLLIEQGRVMVAMGDLLRGQARKTSSRTARERLKEMAEFYEVVRESMESALQRWQRRKTS
ncbi:MAG: hypothetical protein HOW73_08270 [Polyangiaceae bacterium]|nr:hypothetical protein [Polyangiaceae bacterium]